MGRFHSLRINNIRKETADTVSISLDIPADLKEDYSFIPGQYVTFRTNIFKEEVRRSYSICSAPDSGELRVAIKQIKDGIFSTYANTRLKEGEHLDVGIPEGKFILETNIDHKKKYGAFVAGSGITPVLSMIKDVLAHEPKSTFVLMYGNKTPENTIFHERLHELEKKYFGRFFVYYTYTEVNESNALSGRIDAEKVNYIIKNKHKTTPFDSFYLCGPETMIELVSEKLQENRIKKEQIHFELFTASVKDVVSVTPTDDFNGTAQITILVDDEENTITVEENETLLDAALKGGIDAPYSCQGGVCSSCMCLVTEGEVQMIKNSILTDSEIEEGLTLACQAIPKSSNIAIDFDNV